MGSVRGSGSGRISSPSIRRVFFLATRAGTTSVARDAHLHRLRLERRIERVLERVPELAHALPLEEVHRAGRVRRDMKSDGGSCRGFG
eukprot:30828-Pelagococcus_subviridis.AAC.11